MSHPFQTTHNSPRLLIGIAAILAALAVPAAAQAGKITVPQAAPAPIETPAPTPSSSPASSGSATAPAPAPSPALGTSGDNGDGGSVDLTDLDQAVLAMPPSADDVPADPQLTDLDQAVLAMPPSADDGSADPELTDLDKAVLVQVASDGDWQAMTDEELDAYEQTLDPTEQALLYADILTQFTPSPQIELPVIADDLGHFAPSFNIFYDDDLPGRSVGAF